ncbi:hypothetical protein [Brachybacterium sp. YJGR34]|uniref:hypothetical protein n=1 Tax=Brachybacterium sp. YJGR34 TaxID=2059911 RepID=UPI000E0C6F09|nr:hypothetical protein [Brachybacterium sp. YJGR34]
MRSFLTGLTARPPLGDHPMLAALRGQTVVHTRVASRGTWTVTARGWVLHSRIQELRRPGGPPPAADGADAVGLRDERVVAARITAAAAEADGRLVLTLASSRGPLQLSTDPRWVLSGPRGAMLQLAADGEVSDQPAGPLRHATPEALAEHAGSAPSRIEQRLLELGRDQCLHPGHVVTLLAQDGALEDAEFERRGPALLARMLARGELQAGFVAEGRFTPWDLGLETVVEHIGTTWTAIGGRTPGPDMIAWFALTDAGRGALGPTSLQAMPPGMAGYDSPGVVGGFR